LEVKRALEKEVLKESSHHLETQQLGTTTFEYFGPKITRWHAFFKTLQELGVF
jgi:hypothetical protein